MENNFDSDNYKHLDIVGDNPDRETPRLLKRIIVKRILNFIIRKINRNEKLLDYKRKIFWNSKKVGNKTFWKQEVKK